VTTEINLHAPSRLPETYCSDVHERLVLYKRLASVETSDALDTLREELVDRFGPTPEPVQALLACHRLRLLAKQKGVIKIDAAPAKLVNTHCHSDHMGGNAAIARAYGCPIALPASEAPLIEAWDTKTLLLDYADQYADRFVVDETLDAGATYVWGDLEWRALA